MTITPEELYIYGRELLEADRNEVERRNAIGRCYYACLHECRRVVAMLELAPVKRRGSHQTLIATMRHTHDTLAAAQIDKLRIAADGLESFKWYRERADYDLHLSCTKDHALISAAKAEQIMAEVRLALA